MKNKKWLTKVLYTIVGLVPLLLAALISMEMKKRGLLYYGADKSFYHVTMASLSLLIYGDWFTWLANSFFVIAGLGIILLLCGGISEGFKNLLFTSRWVFGLLLFGNVIATVLLQKLMHVNYPEDRTAMYFYFCLILFFCFATDHVEWKPARYLALILLVAPIHFVQRANITHSTYWWYEHLPRSFYAEVEKRAGNVPTSVSIGGYNLMDMIWAYYNHSTGGRLNGMQVSDYPSFYYDYLVLYNDDNCKQAMKDYNLIMESPYSELRLLERKNKIKLNHITTYTVPDRINDRNEFLEFYSSDSLNRYANICFDVEMDVQNTDPFLFASMVVQNFIEDQKTGPQETQELHLLRSQWKKGYKFHQRIYVRGISPNSNRTVSYLWNPRHQAISLTNTQVSIYYWED